MSEDYEFADNFSFSIFASYEKCDEKNERNVEGLGWSSYLRKLTFFCTYICILPD